MKKGKSLSKKRRKQVTILVSTIIAALLIIGILQYAGVINLFEQRVLDSENEGYGHLPRRLSTSAEAQSITIVQIQSITYLNLKITRSDPTPLSTEMVKVSIRSSLSGADLWSNTFTISHLQVVNEGNYPYIPEEAKWVGAWENLLHVSPAVSVTPGQQIFIVVQLTQTLNSDEYLGFWLDEKSDYDRYTGGCEYHMGPGTNYQWISNYGTHTYIDHSFKVYGASLNQPPTVPARPVGPSTGTPGTNYWFETAGSTDPEGGAVEYKWDFGDGTPHPWYNPRTLHSWSSTGTYQVKVKARDDVGAESEWSTATTIVISQEAQNHAPLTPSYSAWEDTLNVGEVGTWSAVSSDPDGNNIFYTWEVDGTVVRQHGFVPSGTYDSLSHTFASTGSHTISVRVRDTPGLYSGWATKTVIVGDEPPEPPSGYQALISVIDSTTYGAIAGASVVCNGELQITDEWGVATYTLPADTYTATASASGYISNSASITVTTSGGSAFVYLDPTENGEPPEEPPEEGFYIVTVEVFDDITNLPVENAKVTANNIDKFTNSNGVTAYTLEGGGKTYSISVIASGYNSDLKTTTVYDVPKTVSFYLVQYGNGEAPPENGEPEPPGIPGFEFMALIVAIGVAFILLKRKKK